MKTQSDKIFKISSLINVCYKKKYCIARYTCKIASGLFICDMYNYLSFFKKHNITYIKSK